MLAHLLREVREAETGQFLVQEGASLVRGERRDAQRLQVIDMLACTEGRRDVLQSNRASEDKLDALPEAGIVSAVAQGLEHPNGFAPFRLGLAPQGVLHRLRELIDHQDDAPIQFQASAELDKLAEVIHRPGGPKTYL